MVVVVSTIMHFRLYSERGILARGLTHPLVFTGQSTPRALDGAVSGIVKQSEQAESTKAATAAAAATPASSSSSASDERERKGKKEEAKIKGRDQNGMMTFFTKVTPNPCATTHGFLFTEISGFSPFFLPHRNFSLIVPQSLLTSTGWSNVFRVVKESHVPPEMSYVSQFPRKQHALSFSRPKSCLLPPTP